jgi:RNA polymerase sigma-70 factor (ECF subfamily)
LEICDEAAHITSLEGLNRARKLRPIVSSVIPPYDEQLMADLQKGDMRAFDTLYDRYSQRLLTYFYRMLGGQEDIAQDFLQDLFIKVIEKSHLFSGPRFSTWIYTMAHNMCKNEYRRLSIRQMHDHHIHAFHEKEEENTTPCIEQHMDYQAFLRALDQALDTLKEEHRQVFLLRHQAHFSIREISEITACSEGTVKSRLFYGLKKPAQKLRPFSPDAIERLSL